MKLEPKCVEQLLQAVMQVATDPPEKPKDHQIEFHMPSASIEQLRRALEACEIDWRTVHRARRRRQ